MAGKRIVIIFVVALLALSATAASAQDDPCAVCWAEWGAACPCLPESDEPPTSSLACVPQTHTIDGCDNKAFMPWIER